MAEREPVRLYMRVQGQQEICIGSARTMSDVPRLLDSVAGMLRAGLEPDETERAADPTRSSSP